MRTPARFPLALTAAALAAAAPLAAASATPVPQGPSSSASLTVLYLGYPDLGLLVHYDRETKELRVYRTCDPYGEVPIDSLLEEYYFKSLRQGSYSRGVDIRNQKMGPPVYIE